MARRSFRSKVLLALLGVGALAALTPPALYWTGLALAPGLPKPPPGPTRLPPGVEAELWARFGGDGPVRVEPLTPGRLLRFEACLTWARIRNASLDDCRGRELDLLLASFVSAKHLGLVGDPPERTTEPGLRAALAHGATTTWITRHWTASQLLRRHAENEGIVPDEEAAPSKPAQNHPR